MWPLALLAQCQSDLKGVFGIGPSFCDDIRFHGWLKHANVLGYVAAAQHSQILLYFNMRLAGTLLVNPKSHSAQAHLLQALGVGSIHHLQEGCHPVSLQSLGNSHLATLQQH